MFELLSGKLRNALSSISNKGSITESDINLVMREVRIALLEADVSLPTIRILINTVKEQALGEKVLSSLKPGDVIIKMIQDEIERILGGGSDNTFSQEHDVAAKNKEYNSNAFLNNLNKHSLNLSSKPSFIMMVGLQGSGKTTSSGKLAQYLKERHNLKIMLCPVDVHRYAAYDQLKIIGEQIKVDVLPLTESDRQKGAVFCTEKAMQQSDQYDVMIVDTAGRLQTDDALMEELREISEMIKPSEKLLVVDSLIGQEATKIARAFNEEIDISGIVLTRVDGDSRGGAALSMITEVGRPVKFAGLGEKMNEFEVFHPDRIASRILGMGDIVSLVEKAKMEDIEAEDTFNKLKGGQFTMHDMLTHIKKIRKMGNIASLIALIPGASKIKDALQNNVTDDVLSKTTAIISSMTQKERINPAILNASRKKRIALGSGVSVQDVNRLMKQYKTMKATMGKLKNMSEDGMMSMMNKMIK